ncbi:MAG: ArsR/SmtB family transcription factor [Streptosporangiaceae bacterium]
MRDEADRVFKALADPTRRYLLDSLRERNGQTLGELCEQLDMARQSASQHVALLAAANLISTVWRGREKLHYLNPVPIYQIQDRWIGNFEHPRLRALSSLKRQAEETTMADRPTFVYVTYIQATPERVWHALTDADLTAEYWGHSNVSDWQAGSAWEHQRTDGSGIADVVGTILAAVPPRSLVMTFESPSGETGAAPALPPSLVTFGIEPHGEIVRLTVTHENLPTDADYEAAAAGWPAVFANLKSLLETGHVLPHAPWEMHTELRDAQLAKHDPR